MPLTAKGEEILANMKKQYGEKQGTEIFYASKNKGTITGVDAAVYEVVRSCSGDVDNRYDVILRVGEKLEWIGSESSGSLFKRSNGERVKVRRPDDETCIKAVRSGVGRDALPHGTEATRRQISNERVDAKTREDLNRALWEKIKKLTAEKRQKRADDALEEV